jgi:hypothetical protein
MIFSLLLACASSPADADLEIDTGHEPYLNSYAGPTQITLHQGHFLVNQADAWSEEWLDGDADDDVIVQGEEAQAYWFFLNVIDSAYEVDYTIDAGRRVELDCDQRYSDRGGNEHGYCWNNSEATLEVFGISGYPE